MANASCLMGNGSLLLFNDISRLYATRPIFPSSLLSYSFIYCLKIDYSLLPHDFALINQNTTSTTMYWLLFTNTVLIIYLRCFGAERTMYWLFTFSSFCANHWTISRSFAHFFASLSTRNHRWLFIYFVVLMLTSFSRRIKYGHFLT